MASASCLPEQSQHPDRLSNPSSLPAAQADLQNKCHLLSDVRANHRSNSGLLLVGFCLLSSARDALLKILICLLVPWLPWAWCLLLRLFLPVDLLPALFILCVVYCLRAFNCPFTFAHCELSVCFLLVLVLVAELSPLFVVAYLDSLLFVHFVVA